MIFFLTIKINIFVQNRNMNKQNKFKENILYVRNCFGETQTQMGARFGINRSRWQSYEDGKGEPSFDDLNLISAGTGIPTEHLIGNELMEKKYQPNVVLQFFIKK